MLNLVLQGYSRAHPQGGRWLVVFERGVVVACWVPYLIVMRGTPPALQLLLLKIFRQEELK